MIPVSYVESDLKFGVLRKISAHIGLVRVFLGRVSVRPGSVGPEPEPLCRPNRNLAHKYPNMTEKTLYDSKFCVDSESAVKFVQATRNHELRAQTCNLGQRAWIGIPTDPNQTEPIFGISIKF